MTYNFDFNIERDGKPYLTTDKASKYISDILYSRVSSDKPLLESRVAEELASTSETTLSEDERVYILNILVSLNIDNYAKGKLAHPLMQDIVNGVPVLVTRWQLRAQLAKDYGPNFLTATDARSLEAQRLFNQRKQAYLADITGQAIDALSARSADALLGQ